MRSMSVIRVIGGAGGNGAIHFRRVKYNGKAGPFGGRGGNGGHVILKASDSVADFSKLKPYYDNKFVYKAQDGQNGSNKLRSGTHGEHLVIEVPSKVSIYDINQKKVICTNLKPDSFIIGAHGGSGGAGNADFANSANQCPQTAEIGAKGIERLLEMKIL